MASSDSEEQGPGLSELIARIARRETLDVAAAEAAFVEVMEGRATPVQMAALLVALRVRGESAQEIAGGVRALRRAMVPVAVSALDVVDTCGTGGGAVTTFNISTAAAILAAGAGVRIAKHGNRSFSSRCGSADVLEALGIRIELTPVQMAEVFERAGIVFMFAPLLHPAMRHVAPIRRELAMPTIMNVLGPLTNPANAQRQVVGVADPRLVELIAGALRELGHLHALVVHGEPGLDELSPIGPTDIVEVRAGELQRYRVEPADFGFSDADPLSLAGADPIDNARIIRGLFDGSIAGAPRAAVTLNAGAAIYVAGQAASLADGVATAERALTAGAAAAALERLRAASHAV
jgi:anthranilate phosphoribosyltransferase